MAIINKTGITNGGTIQAEHVTRVIDALSSVSTDSIVATGSFTGSFKGDGSQLSGVSAGFPFTGSARITGSLAVTGSLTVVSSFVASSSYMDISAADRFLVSAPDTYFTGSSGKGFGSVTFGNKTALNLQNIDTGPGFSIPLKDSTAPTTGSMYWDDVAAVLYIYQASTATWVGFQPTL